MPEITKEYLKKIFFQPSATEIAYMFVWEETHEGYDYWRSLSSGEKPMTEEAQKKINEMRKVSDS